MRDWQPTPDQSRASLPVEEGFARRSGTSIFYEVHGSGPETLVFVPPWAIVHSRGWKMQVGWFAGRYRVVLYDPRGNGRSSSPTSIEAYSEHEYAADLGAVLDATRTDRAHLVTWSRGAQRCLLYAAEHPERVSKLVFIAPGTTLSDEFEARSRTFHQVLAAPDPGDEALHKLRHFNKAAWLRDPAHYRRFLVDFFESWFEPHSSKPIEDALSWGLAADPEAVANAYLAWQPDAQLGRDLCRRVPCPALVIHGARDEVVPPVEGEVLAGALGGQLELIEGSGHGVAARKPVEVNLAIRDFLDPTFERKKRARKRSRGPKRALFVSSPIGLGHAQRDIAIAHELRRAVPDLQVDWLAQDPVTRVLSAEGESIHEASRKLASESRHIESESAEHDLHCFQAIRRMDEIMIHDFMIFHDVMREGAYDLVVGDESWEIDYYLHENPNEKRAPYAWLTDFVGFLPMSEGDDHEAYLTADYNAEMIGHIEGRPDVRDRAIFLGNPEDVVTRPFGPELPGIREWTEAHYDFAGYVTGFDPAALGDPQELRDALGYRPDEKVCIVSVGGSGVGHHLLRRIIDAYPHAKRLEPALRMLVVAGPRIDPASLPAREGLEIVPYVHNLYRHLAVCDVAIVQGGLTTAMELTANRRPFLYFPLAHHFEQNIHVRHRLDNYGAGRCMDYASETPETIADALVVELRSARQPRPVETDGARRAAASIADLL